MNYKNILILVAVFGIAQSVEASLPSDSWSASSTSFSSSSSGAYVLQSTAEGTAEAKRISDRMAEIAALEPLGQDAWWIPAYLSPNWITVKPLGNKVYIGKLPRLLATKKLVAGVASQQPTAEKSRQAALIRYYASFPYLHSQTIELYGRAAMYAKKEKNDSLLRIYKKIDALKKWETQ